MIYTGDSLEVMKTLDSNSIDCVVADPPYNLGGKGSNAGFMGRTWDVLPPVSLWQEMLRVMKPGAFAAIIFTPRQDSLCQLLGDLEAAGFVTGFTSLYWCYHQGFPKAHNIAKSVDKRLGAVREVIGIRKIHDIRVEPWVGSDAKYMDYEYTKSSTDEAKSLEGTYAGFQPKPSIEPVVIVMKPIEHNTYTDQALDNGLGVTHLDDCRIPYQADDDALEKGISRSEQTRRVYATTSGKQEYKVYKTGMSKEGRFPANIISEDNALDNGIESSTKPRKFNVKPKMIGTILQSIQPDLTINDKGSPNRYYDLDAWYKERIKLLPEDIQKTFPVMMVPKAGKKEKNLGLNGSDKEYIGRSMNAGEWKEMNIKVAKNNHCTVKPLKLLHYLITLFSAEGQTVLDPFLGSGSTGVAAVNLNREFIGIEREKEYVEIAEARIDYATKQNNHPFQQFI